MARSITDICNEALGEVPAELISSIDDGTMSARHCTRLYPKVVEDLIEFHDWDFAIKRVALALIATDRPEWNYAYALPVNMGSPRKLIPDYATSAGPYCYGNTAARFDQLEDAIPYTIADGKLYANICDASLEYVSNAVDASQFTSMFARAVALELAVRLVMPILNDRQRQGDLTKEAEVAKQRAVADDINRNKSNDLNFVSESAMARGVGGDPLGRWA